MKKKNKCKKCKAYQSHRCTELCDFYQELGNVACTTCIDGNDNLDEEVITSDR